ncbi:uncharacterized protein [Rutidosis leptorrhynchoides]|uniref:uncharacterized protein n=1 Tax=Rutidosis leptorrhynchoides TaxID=125765 RepID=UPI003A995F7C
MSSPPSDNSTTPEPQPPKTLETQNPNEDQNAQNQEDEEEEEEGECGFCLFMKGGACKETFINWEKCIEAGEKNNEDIVEKCYAATSALKKCMEANQDYYGVILQAEKDAEEQAMNQLQQEKQKEKEGVIYDDINQYEKKENEVVDEQER